MGQGRMEVPCVNGDADKIRSANYETVLKYRIFLVRTSSLFTLPTFGAQINWHIISRKALFAPHRFLSNKSPIHVAGESGNRNTFLNDKWHVQNENGHRHGARLMPNNCKNLNSPYFSLPTTFKGFLRCLLCTRFTLQHSFSYKIKFPFVIWNENSR
jgi:hypothetical protein